MAMSSAVMAVAQKTSTKEAVAIEAFAHALTALPTILADNAGLFCFFSFLFLLFLSFFPFFLFFCLSANQNNQSTDANKQDSTVPNWFLN